MKLASIVLAAACVALLGSSACAQIDGTRSAFQLDHTIPLPNVKGRIDHLALDPAGTRLAVAELENHSVDIIDLAHGAVVHRFTDLPEPQGVAFDLTGHVIAIATGGDGALRLVDAATYDLISTISLGDDADDVRIDPRNGHVVVGYGAGALAVIDITSHAILQRIALPAHPEGFQIDAETGRAFVNLPDRRTIAVVDLDHAAVLSVWRLPLLLWNYPMALDPEHNRLASVFRGPARLVLFDRSNGAVLSSQATCGDSDDVFFDAHRHALYVACGAGRVDSFDVSAQQPRRLAPTPTSTGARTALFDPRSDRLFVAARTHDGLQASILVLKPAP